MMMPRFLRYGVLRPLVQLGLLLALTAAVPGAPKPLVWAFGDSLTAGLGLPPDQGFVPRLQAALRGSGIAADVRNGGVSGDTAAQGRARLLWGLRGLGAKPDLVIVELGANDMLRGLDPTATRTAIETIISRLKARNIAVMLLGMLSAPNLGPDYQHSFDAIFPDLAAKYGLPLYPFFLDGVAGERRLNQPDGMHPTAEGVDAVVKNILPTVEAFLGALSGQRS